jgi:DNA ligase-4
MPFRFGEICKLLSQLESLKQHHPPLLPDALKAKTQSKVEYWFKCNRTLIHAPGVDGVAIISTLFPEKRTDRVYGLKEDRLCKIIGRCLRLNSTSRKILEDWRTPGRGDLGDRLERIQEVYDGEPNGHPVTVEEVDNVLQLLASRNRFSGPEIRSSKAPTSSSDDLLGDIFCRLKSFEAKWLTRLILKDFSPVVLDEYLVLNAYHFLLPSLLKFQDSFSAAIDLLRGPFSDIPSSTTDPFAERTFKRQAAKLLSPQVGVKVGRPQFLQARSMENCVKLANQQTWSVERKYDGIQMP